MFNIHFRRLLLLVSIVLLNFSLLVAQNNFKLKYTNSSVYAGIEVGSKGVKMSLVEVGKNAQSRGAFNGLKDTSVNTDFISFTEATFQATLKAISGLYRSAIWDYKVLIKNIFTTISSGVKVQADKEDKNDWINNLVDSFKLRINEPKRKVEIVDVLHEAKLSHLGIVPEEKRYTTFLIDIGSGNSKGGYFPNGNTKDFKLFQLSWGTKSVANTAEKRLDDNDKTLTNYDKQLFRVLAGAENADIIYAVNESGAYPASDNIAFSGGIAWSVATLLYPEQIDNSVVTVTYEDVQKLSDKLFTNYASLSDVALVKNIKDKTVDKTAAANEIKRVHSVFDQRSLMAGTGLLLKVMRQFKSVYESKQFYFVKNGQVGWISAYVDQNVTAK